MPLFLSKVVLDTKRWDVSQAVENRNLLHKKVMALFVSKELHENARQELGVLYRVEGSQILLQSKIRPEGSALGLSLSVTKEISENMKAVRAGSSFRFRLEANTSRRYEVQPDADLWVPDAGRGGSLVKERTMKSRGCRTYEERRKWLEEKAAYAGFRLGFYETDARPIVRVNDGVMEVTQFNGILKIVNIYSFQKAILGGIGRGKAYGLGLLSIKNS